MAQSRGELAEPNALLSSERIHSGTGEGGCDGGYGGRVILYLSVEPGDCVGESCCCSCGERC